MARLDADGLPQAIFFNNAVRSWYYEAPPAEIPKLYDALSVFNEYLYQPRHLLQLKMENGPLLLLHRSSRLDAGRRAGDLMMFSNNRVLHGRSAFQLEADKPVTRHLEGGFMSFDVVRSKIRTLNDHFHEVPTPPPSLLPMSPPLFKVKHTTYEPE